MELVPEGWWRSMSSRYGLWEPWKAMDKRARDAVAALCVQTALRAVIILRRCESPIEERLVAWLLFHAWAKRERPLAHGEIEIEPQAEICTESGRYRADVLVRLVANGRTISLVVECDGHDFHEKTKAQAAHDKRRDRALKLAGYEVIRFAGSEIWSNPSGCAEEVIAHLNALAQRKQG